MKHKLFRHSIKITCFTLLFILCLSPVVCAAETTIIVYTPRGSAVQGYVRSPEHTFNEMYEINSYYGYAYPSATKLRDATIKYNCHSYAWYTQSASNIVWIGLYNATDHNPFFTDGSYNFVTSSQTTNILLPLPGSIGDKIRYISDNHSAIKTSSTKLISKWGQAGLYEHDRFVSPYIASNIYFYR